MCVRACACVRVCMCVLVYWHCVWVCEGPYECVCARACARLCVCVCFTMLRTDINVFYAIDLCVSIHALGIFL